MVQTMQANFLQEIALIKVNLQLQPSLVQFSPTPLNSTNIMMRPSQAQVPYLLNPQQQITFIPQSLCLIIKVSEIAYYIQEERKHNRSLPFIAISETWLKSYIPRQTFENCSAAGPIQRVHAA